MIPHRGSFLLFFLLRFYIHLAVTDFYRLLTVLFLLLQSLCFRALYFQRYVNKHLILATVSLQMH